MFYNDISIIYELNKNNPKVHYIGILRPEFYESDVQIIPITFPFSASHIWWHNAHVDSLSLSFHFKVCIEFLNLITGLCYYRYKYEL